MLDASQGCLCCDDPDLVTDYYPKIACRACGLIWDEYILDPKPPRREFVVAAELPLTA